MARHEAAEREDAPRENGLTAADYQQAAETHTSTQSDSLGVTSTTTTAPSLNRGAAAPAGAPRAAGPASSLPAPGLLPPGSGKMTPQQVKDNIVDMVGQYRYNPTQLARLQVKHPEIIAAINQKYPDWDQVDYNAKNDLMRKYTSGTPSKEINAINTALGHIGVLGDAVAALDNNNIPVLNKIANAVGVQLGETPVTTFNTIVHRVGPELAAAYIQGGGTSGERGTDEKDFDPSKGTKQLYSNVGITAKLLRSKIGSLENQYKNTVKRDDFTQRFITPEAQHTLDRFSPQSSSGPAAGSFAVTTPNGKTYTFPSQQKLDEFKKSANIQ
jgi:hypothetical protein